MEMNSETLGFIMKMNSGTLINNENEFLNSGFIMKMNSGTLVHYGNEFWNSCS